MTKKVLYIIIFFLAGALSFVLWAQLLEKEEARSNITISPTEIISGDTDEQVVAEEEDGGPLEGTAETQSPLVLSGSLVDVREVPNRQGGIDIIVLVNDGTEVISANANALAEPGVLAPVDTLGLEIGQTVTLKGYLESNVFILTEIE